jgi:D-lactate dehydrogenase
MKIFVYNYRELDEGEYFSKFAKEFGAEIVYTQYSPRENSVKLAEGSKYISIVTTKINEALLKQFHDIGVEMISSRTVGYDHIDLEAAKRLGIKVCNGSYPPNTVADYTLMLMLMTARKAGLIIERVKQQNFTTPGLQGRNLSRMTVGIMGTGRVGKAVIKRLAGFGCRILAYSRHEDEEVKQYASYVSLEQLYAECDMISLHMPATKDNYHIIHKESIEQMKDKVIIINTARGSLINIQDLITGVKSGKIGGAGLDVLENEAEVFKKDLRGKVMDNSQIAALQELPNVILTPHVAYYTDEAISNMVFSSVKSCYAEEKGLENPWRIV